MRPTATGELVQFGHSHPSPVHVRFELKSHVSFFDCEHSVYSLGDTIILLFKASSVKGSLSESAKLPAPI